MTALFRFLLPVMLTAMALAPVALKAETILTISDPEGVVAEFSLDALDALEQHVTVASTPWYEGPQEFTGPLIRTIMEAAGLTATELTFVAVNDYSAAMPWADIIDYPVILASRHNGQEMSLRDKGPLFVIYPFNDFPDLRNEVYHGRSVWQVKAIEARS